LDPELGTRIAVAEAALNVAVTGARPLALTNCLNFGNPENPEIFWQFAKAAEGLAEAAAFLETPVTGGNVSFYNEYDGKAVFPTPVVGMLGCLDDVGDRISFHFKKPGDRVLLLGRTLEELGASEAHFLLTGKDEGRVPSLDLSLAKALNGFFVQAAKEGLLASAHDLSEGGLAVALAEAAFPLGIGLSLEWEGSASPAAMFFGESQSRAAVSARPEKLGRLEALLGEKGIPFSVLGETTDGPSMSLRYRGELLEAKLFELKEAYEGTFAKLAEI
jgi:phosphoribosylformylglycinamidine synthase